MADEKEAVGKPAEKEKEKPAAKPAQKDEHKATEKAAKPAAQKDASAKAEGAKPPAPKTAEQPGTPAPKRKAPATAKGPKPKTVGKSDIGIAVKAPAKTCTDQNCPFHGRLPVRGQIFEGIVVLDKMDKSAVIMRERLVYVPKYERYLKRTSRLSVHSPPCIGAKAGDWVTVMECRPLSKTISFTIVTKKVDAKVRAEREE
jgi:small subunit ribosomal protein S17